MPGEKILVVDDDPIQLKLTRILLAAKGYDVETAETAQFAIEVVRTFRPSLIITDFQLPDVDGLELVRQLKANAESRHIPIVLLTSGFHGIDEKAARDGGCAGFMTKPIRAQTFAEQVGSFLRSGTTGPAAAAGELVLVVNDDPIERQVLEERLKEAGFTVATAADGAEGLDQARRLKPAAIVSDILMPRFDGFQLCNAIREDVSLQHIPLVLTTSGSIQKNDELMAHTMGANAFVLRTADMKQVIDAVFSGIAEGAPNTFTVDATLIESLRRFFLEEGERQSMRLIDQLATGLNRNSLRRMSHRWAGVAGTFGYSKISDAARELEALAQRGAVDEEQMRTVLLELSELFMDAVGRN